MLFSRLIVYLHYSPLQVNPSFKYNLSILEILPTKLQGSGVLIDKTHMARGFISKPLNFTVGCNFLIYRSCHTNCWFLDPTFIIAFLISTPYSFSFPFCLSIFTSSVWVVFAYEIDWSFLVKFSLARIPFNSSHERHLMKMSSPMPEANEGTPCKTMEILWL